MALPLTLSIKDDLKWISDNFGNYDVVSKFHLDNTRCIYNNLPGKVVKVDLEKEVIYEICHDEDGKLKTIQTSLEFIQNIEYVPMALSMIKSKFGITLTAAEEERLTI